MNRQPRAQSRSQSRRRATVERLEATLTCQLGRPPTDAEIAKLLARSRKAIARLRARGGRDGEAGAR